MGMTSDVDARPSGHLKGTVAVKRIDVDLAGTSVGAPVLIIRDRLRPCEPNVRHGHALGITASAVRHPHHSVIGQRRTPYAWSSGLLRYPARPRTYGLASSAGGKGSLQVVANRKLEPYSDLQVRARHTPEPTRTPRYPVSTRTY